MLRKKEMQSVINGIEKVNLSKLEDKPMSTALFKDYFLLCGKQRQYEEARKDLQNLFLKKHEKEQEAVSKLQGDFNLEKDPERRIELAKEINSHSGYLEAVKSLNEKMEAMANEVVKVELIDGEKFSESYQKQDDWDIAVVRMLFPLFREDALAPEGEKSEPKPEKEK